MVRIHPGPLRTPLDARERSELCDLFLELGPDAPTLCEGWTTADLAAHLVVRERDPRIAPALLFGGRFETYANRLYTREKQKGYGRVVARVRSGPPPVPWRIPGLRDFLNLQEYFVHHEDVRRANGMTRRTGVGDVEDALWQMLKRAAVLQLRKVEGAGVDLVRPSTGDAIAAKKGTPRARLVGEPGELVLYLLGRGAHAQVGLEGDPDAVRAVEASAFGI